MNNNQMKKADFVSSIVLIAFSISVIWMSLNMPRLEEKGINPYTAPGVVPGILGVIILFLSLIMFIRTLRHGDFLPRFTAGDLKSFFRSEGILRLSVALGLSLVYALVLVGHIPYILATFLFIFSFILCFDLKFDATEGSKKRIILVALAEAVITAVAVSAAFEYLFLVDLP